MNIVTGSARTIGAALVLAGLLAGCSSGPAVAAKDKPDTATTSSAASASPAATPSASAAPSSSAAPATETSSAPAVVALEGTSWAGTDSDGDDYVYRFKPNGKFGYTSPNGTFDQPSETWSQSGNQITLLTNNGYSTRIGTIEGDTINGTASNVQGHTWTWTATKQ